MKNNVSVWQNEQKELIETIELADLVIEWSRGCRVKKKYIYIFATFNF